MQEPQHHPDRKKNVLAWRLIIAILLFSLLITLVSTGVQLYVDFRRDISSIEKSLDQVEESNLDAISAGLWQYDMELVRTQMEGISRLQDVVYLAVYDGERLLLAVGEPSSEAGMIRDMPLGLTENGQRIPLGTLHVEVSMTGLRSRLLNRLVVILITQATQIFLVSSFIFFLFYRLIGSHLDKMAEFARGLRLDTLNTRMELARPPPGPGRRSYDELDEVENALNGMRLRLSEDIRKRQEAESALRASEMSYRRLVQNIPGVVHRFSLSDRKTEFISESVKQVTGRDAAEFLDGSIRLCDLVYPDDRDLVSQAIEQSRRQGKPYEVEYRLGESGNDCRIIQEYGAPLAEDLEGRSWVDAVFFEVTARRETERRLDTSTRLLHTLIEATTDAVFIKDTQGRYLLVNSATLRAMGKDEAEVLGRRDADIFPSESASVIEQADAMVLASGISQTLEERIESAYGDSYWFVNKSPIFDGDGKLLGLVGISRNVTERMLAEQERESLEKRLQQAQKMEALGTLAGGIAHDFNNILSVVLGYAELLQDDLAHQEVPRQKVDHVLKAGYRARDLVQQILAFSRMTEEKLIHIQPASSIREGLKLLRATIPANIVIREAIDPYCRVIAVNPIQLHQVLMNLCTNASHALEETGGTIEVSLQNRQLAAGEVPEAPRLQGEVVELRVTDDGPGIEEEMLGRIFEPYFTTKGVGKGTGMGLSIVHGIAAKCGGAAICSSMPGNGASFSVFFPAVAAPLDQPEVELDAVPKGTERILLVDDEPPLLEVARLMLEKLGYTVSAFASGLAALSAFEDDPDAFDLVLTDQTMPDITGANLAGRILRIRPGMPILLCTGFSAVIGEEKAREIGIAAYVHKPLKIREIAMLLRQLLDGEPER